MNEKENFLRIALSATKEINENVPLVPFSNWDYYYIERPLSWKSDLDPSIQVDVPKGFVTDLASIPRIFWVLLPKAAEYTYPAIFHDYLYWFQPPEYDRDRADQTLEIIMEEIKVNTFKVKTIAQAVRLFGGSSWKANRLARERGERRVLKAFPGKPTISWQEWRQRPDVFA